MRQVLSVWSRAPRATVTIRFAAGGRSATKYLLDGTRLAPLAIEHGTLRDLSLQDTQVRIFAIDR